MKNLMLVLTLISATSMASIANAKNCSGGGSELCELAPYFFIASITSAPTGTTMIISDSMGNRDEVLAIQQDAINYKITGDVSPLLQSAVQSVLENGTDLSSEDIVNKIVAAKIN